MPERPVRLSGGSHTRPSLHGRICAAVGRKSMYAARAAIHPMLVFGSSGRLVRHANRFVYSPRSMVHPSAQGDPRSDHRRAPELRPQRTHALKLQQPVKAELIGWGEALRLARHFSGHASGPMHAPRRSHSAPRRAMWPHGSPRTAPGVQSRQQYTTRIRDSQR